MSEELDGYDPDESIEDHFFEDWSCDGCGSSECDGFCAGSECGRYCQDTPGGMWPVGMCTLAGTEQCDFECPYRDG